MQKTQAESKINAQLPLISRIITAGASLSITLHPRSGAVPTAELLQAQRECFTQDKQRKHSRAPVLLNQRRELTQTTAFLSTETARDTTHLPHTQHPYAWRSMRHLIAIALATVQYNQHKSLAAMDKERKRVWFCRRYTLITLLNNLSVRIHLSVNEFKVQTAHW